MIVKQDLTGYAQSVGNIMQCWVWHKSFATKAPMRFLPGTYSDIADIWIQSDSAISIGMYPFTAPSVLDIAKEHEPELLSILNESNRDIVTVRISDKRISPLLKEEFTDYFPHYVSKDEMYIFNTPEDGGGFPSIYFMSKANRVGVNVNTLDVLAHVSHEVYDPAGKDTEIGKEFTFMLIQSRIQGHFVPEVPPLKDINFPSNGKDATVPGHLNVENLEKLLTTHGVDKLPAKESKDTPLLPAPKIVPEEDDDDYDVLSDTAIEDNLVEEVLARGTVNLSDVAELGIGKTLKMIGESEFVIDIVMDIPEAAKKMCIWMNNIWVIPQSDEFDPEESFGEPSSFFVICTEENFPRNALAG